MQPLSRADRVCAVAAAAAHDLNEELTIILTVLSLALRDDEIEHEMLIEAQHAAQRCAWKAMGLLNFSARKGARPSSVTLEKLIEDEIQPT